MGVIIKAGRLHLGTEHLRCPRCKGINIVEIHTDHPASDWLICQFCGYKAIINFIPLLDKYGLPHGLSKPEMRDIGKHLKEDLAKL